MLDAAVRGSAKVASVAEDSSSADSTSELSNLFKGRTPAASEVKSWAEKQGWQLTKKETGPLKYADENGVNRVTLKQGSSRAPGSANPHAEFRNASGERVDPFGNLVSRRSIGNHTPVDWDL